ncbi:MAG: 4'-phosphopantetheinyl transferase family protein [Christensenellales bacterium]
MKIYIVKGNDKEDAINKIKAAYQEDVGERLVWHYDDRGKPIGENCCLSISHTKGLYVMAVSDKQVGIDVESKERKIPSKLGDIRLWTQKEAYGKRQGSGLTRQIIERFVGDDDTRTIDLEDGYWLSVCGEDKAIEIIRL